MFRPAFGELTATKKEVECLGAIVGHLHRVGQLGTAESGEGQVHIGGGILATAACVICFPFAAWLTLAVGGLLTLGSYSLQTVLRFWLEDLEGL